MPVFDAKPAKPAPAKEKVSRMFGSLLTIAVMACWCSLIESTEIPCAACVNPITKPESSLERNPLGIWRKKYTVPISSRREPKSVAKRCLNTPFKLQS